LEIFHEARVDEGAQLHKRSVECEDPRGRETILLAEDEQIVRELIREILESCGYHVLVAENGREALLKSDSHPGRIPLLITDVVMPGMGGPALAERLLQSRPEVRVLYMSGYTDDFIAHDGLLDVDVPFIQKPFAADDLTQKVRTILGEAP
jgi:CheY-like chemotaxis protein